MRAPNHNLNFLHDVINRILVSAGRSKVARLSPVDEFQSDLGLDSLELAEMTVVIEAKFGVDVFEDGVAATVQDVLDRIEE